MLGLGPLALPVAISCVLLSAYLLVLFVEQQETGGGLQLFPFRLPWEE